MSENIDIIYSPHTFRRGSSPAGYRYCVGVPRGEGRHCIEHGLVFGGLEEIPKEITDDLKGAALVASRWPLAPFGRCGYSEKEYILRSMPRSPAFNAQPLEWRIYRARLAKLSREHPRFVIVAGAVSEKKES